MKKIHWERTDGRRMSSNMVAYSSRLIFNKGHLSSEDYGSYTCVAETYSGRLLKKEHWIRPGVSNSNPSSSAAPIVRIIPIVKDIREGGRVELECETGR